jgi:acyl carrier protein
VTTTDIVLELVRDTLGAPADVVIAPDQLLFYDLGFTSMDLLDLIFRLEERFAIAIPEGTILRLAQGDLSDAELAVNGHLTPAGRARLMALLHDSPPAIFPEAIHVQTLPRYCTVAAFIRLVEHELARG